MSQAYVCDSCGATIGKTDENPARADVNINVIGDVGQGGESAAVANNQSISNKNLSYCNDCFKSNKVTLAGYDKPEIK